MWVEMDVGEAAESAIVQESLGSMRLVGYNSTSPSYGHKGALATAVKGDLDVVLKEL